MNSGCRTMGKKDTTFIEYIVPGPAGKLHLGYSYYVCEKCEWDFADDISFWNYCPHCGRKITEVDFNDGRKWEEQKNV